MKHIRVSLALAATGAAALAATALAPPVAAAPADRDQQEAKAASARYHSLEQAEREGFVSPGENACVSSPAGGMGFHYTNASRIDTTLDALQPEVLLYAPDENGRLRLAGVEYVVRDADGDLSTDEDRPTLFGQQFAGPMPGHVPGMPVHYDLHAWFWVENPHGTFTQFNPAVSC